jgi:tetratricopeptide (TPR) repeat protein
MQFHRFILSATLTVTLLAGCKERSTPPPPNPVTSTAARTLADPEFTRIAKKIEEAINTDTTASADLADIDALFDRATGGINAPKNFRESFIRGAKDKGIENILARSARDKPNCRLLNVFDQDGQTHAIYRILDEEGGFTYHDWILHRSKDGKIRAVDLYPAASGEYVSQLFRRIYLSALALVDKRVSATLTPAERAYGENFEDLRAISQHSTAGRHDDVLKVYRRLPQVLQEEKYFLLIRIVAAGKLTEEQPGDYEKAVALYQKRYPGDPALDILSIDALFTEKKFAEILLCYDRLEQWTGGDPYIKSLRGECLLQEKKAGAAPEAEKLARAAIAAEPDLLDARYLLVKSLCAQKKFAEAVIALESYERLIERPVSTEDIEELNDLAVAPEYIAYREKNPIQTPPPKPAK